VPGLVAVEADVARGGSGHYRDWLLVEL
jgi:hypothetical protein